MKSSLLRWTAVPFGAALALRAFEGGPHSEITQAALDVPGTNHALKPAAGI